MKQERWAKEGTVMSICRVAVVALAFVSALSACSSLGKAAAAKERLATAQAMFAQRCQTAGVKIVRRIEDVEGFLLLKLRPAGINHADQYKLDDPYGSDLGGDGYIESFLRGSYEAGHSVSPNSAPVPGAPPTPVGYDYVEAIDQNDGQRYRYTGSVREVERTSSITMGGSGKKFKTNAFALDRVLSVGPAPRYGVTYEDISTREERDYWIAGSSLKVIDLQTNEVIAERVGYMIDVRQGNVSGGRSPWLWAADHACPSFQRNPLRPPGNGAQAQSRQTQYFVEKILVPKKDHKQ
jgi:hypothetical protein